MAAQQKFRIVGFVLVFLMLIQLQFPSSAQAYKCKWNEYTVQDILGNTSCLQCPICPPGYGLSPECDSFIKYGERFECKSCIEGKTYSSDNDIGTCRPCGVCTHENVIRNCTLTQNSNCGTDCEKGFYYDSVTMDCQPCSWCCFDGKDEFIPHCKDKGMPSYKQCNVNRGSQCYPAECISMQEYVVVNEKTLTRSCQKCSKCGIGQGLTPKCGSVITNSSQPSCKTCLPGVDFSTSEDPSSCKPCTKCAVGKKVERPCNSTHDILCGDCLPGFYRDTSTTDELQCKQCSYCCGDDKDVIIKECALEGMPPNRQCAYTERAISVCAPKKNVFYKHSSAEWYYYTPAVIVIIFIAAAAIVCLVCRQQYCRGYKKLMICQPSPDETRPRHEEIPELEPPTLRDGTMLWFPKSGVKLHLPEQYTATCADKAVYDSTRVSILWSQHVHYPHLNENQVCLSPIIKLHSSGDKLQKPVTVELPHCADLTKPCQWSLQVLKQVPREGTVEWGDDLLAETPGETSLNFEVYDLDAVYVVVGTCMDRKIAKKRMVCVPFAGTPIPGEPITVSIHLIDDCEPSLMKLIKEQKKLGRGQQSSRKLCQLDTDERSLASIKIQAISEGWTLHSMKPSKQPWYNSLVTIPTFEAVFNNTDPTKGDFKCTLALMADSSTEPVAEVTVFLYLQNPCTQTASQIDPDKPEAFVETPITPGYRLLSNLPQDVTRNICKNIPEIACITIATKLMALVADELQTIKRSGRPSTQASQLIKTLNEKRPELSVIEFSSTLKETPDCEEATAFLESFLKENGGVECV